MSADTLASVLKGEPDLTLLPPDVPAAARTLIERCLAKDRRQRVGDIAVARFVLSETGPAAAPSAGAAATHGAPWKLALAMAASVVVTTTVAAAVAWSLWPASARPQPIRFTWTLSQRQALFLIARQSMAISSDGTQIVYVAGNELYKRALSDLDASPISGTFFGQTTAVMSPAISPDGRSVAFWADNSIKTDSNRGRRRLDEYILLRHHQVCLGIRAVSSSVSWQEGVWRCAPSGGAPQQLATVNSDKAGFMARTSCPTEQRQLLFTVAKAEGGPWPIRAPREIFWQSLTTGERKTVNGGEDDGRPLPTGHLLSAVSGTILADSIDAERGVVLGDAVPVVEGVRRSSGGTVGTAHLVTSATGVLAYMPGSANAATNQSIAISDRTGNARPLPLLAGPYVGVRPYGSGRLLPSPATMAVTPYLDRHTGTDSAAQVVSRSDGRNRSPVPSPEARRGRSIDRIVRAMRRSSFGARTVQAPSTT